MYICGLVSVPVSAVPIEATKRQQILWGWHSRKLCVSIQLWVVGHEGGSSARAVRTLSHCQ